jgi:pSer/pThr/pTyr-binding forkhead associated (FHA) protein
MDSVSGKFCPVCNHKNEPSATVCAYCGSPLEYGQASPSTTRRVNRKEEETNVLPQRIEETLKKTFQPPEEGIAIYVKEYAAPAEILKEREFTLGRHTTEEVEKAFVDLKPFGGYVHGVSRRHALIRRTEHGIEILDLGSSNGTWLNKKRLTPDKPYPLENGAEVYLGQLQIFVIYQEMAAKP